MRLCLIFLHELLKTKILNNKKHDLIRHQSEIKDRLAKDIILRNFYTQLFRVPT